jgi:DNA-binding SARP family transcriptional activator
MASCADVDAGEPVVRFMVLGPLAVRSAGGEDLAVKAPRCRQVLATLLLLAGQQAGLDLALPGVPCTSAWLAQAIWGDDQPEDPSGALRTAVYGLRRCLGVWSKRLESPRSGYSYAFNAAPGEADIMLFIHLAHQGRIAWYHDKLRLAEELLAAAARLWRDPAMDDIPSTPVLADARDTLTRARRDVEDMLMRTRLQIGGYREAVPDLRRTLASNPRREHTYALLMRALLLEGRADEAQQVFAEAEAMLREQYGCGPGPELADLLRRTDQREPVSATAWRRAAAAPGTPRARGHQRS